MALFREEVMITRAAADETVKLIQFYLFHCPWSEYAAVEEALRIWHEDGAGLNSELLESVLSALDCDRIVIANEGE